MQRVWIGVRYMLLSVAGFALMNVFVKFLPEYPAHEIVLFRSVVAVALTGIFIHQKGIGFGGNNYKLLFLRGIIGTTALYCFFLTIQKMPLASAVTIQYLSPIFTAMIAIVVLREKVWKRQWVFYGISLLGVILVKGFDPRVDVWYFSIGIFSAFCSAMAYNLVRKLRNQDHPLTVVFYFALVAIPPSVILSLFHWRQPVGLEWLWLSLSGVGAFVGQWYLTLALQLEKANLMSSINYVGIVFALLFGWIIFGETFGLVSLTGMLLVVGGVVMNIMLTPKN